MAIQINSGDEPGFYREDWMAVHDRQAAPAIKK